MRSLVQVLRIGLSLLRVLRGLPGQFIGCLVVLLAAMLRGDAVGMGGVVVQLCGSLVILVV